MSEELGPQEDISALWGPQGNGVLEPARPRVDQRPDPAPNGHGHELDDRLVAVERDLRRGMADLTERLARLEHEVAALRESRRASLARISKAIKGH